MYNEIIVSKLNNLKNLHNLKNANVTIISKKNEYGDIVKFFAQINTEDVIQKISYKATGCSSFVAMCSYFCELVENKSIKEALKISRKDLEALTVLSESRVHVFDIIIGTFALLIKKYEKGLKLGKITPCKVLSKTEEFVENKQPAVKKNKKEIKFDDLDGMIVKTKKTIAKPTKKATSTKIEKKHTTAEQTKINNPEMVSQEDKQETQSKNVINEIEKKETKKVSRYHVDDELIEKVNAKIDIKSLVSDINKINHPDTKSDPVKDRHLTNLLNKIENKNINDKAQQNSQSLNDILRKINENNLSTKKKEKSLENMSNEERMEAINKINSLNLSSHYADKEKEKAIAKAKKKEQAEKKTKKETKKLEKSNSEKTKTKKTKKEKNTVVDNKVKEEPVKKEKTKKSLFSFFRKK